MLIAERRPLELVKRDLAKAQILLLDGKPDDPKTSKLLTWYWALAEEAAEQDRWSFCRTMVKTQDEHVDTSMGTPFKRIPELDYLKQLVAVWDEVSKRQSNRILFIHKSRQMMVSWLAATMVLWSSLFESGRTIGWQSKKAEDANWMLRRIFGIWERLPDDVKHRHPCEIKEGEIRFTDRNNVVMAVPEGPDKPRQFTWSLFISDEMAFQAMARETYVAVQPAIRGGGMYVGISSAAPGFFMEMVEDAA